MATSVAKLLEEEVNCPLCMDIFTDPKKLPCDHSFCLKCLQKLVLRSLDGNLTCPVCRSTTPLEVSDASQFPTAHHVNRLKDIYHKKLQEDQPKQEAPPPAAEDPPSQLPTCQLHASQPLALYCETCRKKVCRDCALTLCVPHKHTSDYLEDMEKKHNSRANDVLQQNRSLREDLLAADSAWTEEHLRLKKLKDDEEKDVNQAFEDFVKTLMAEKARFLQKIEEKYSRPTSQAASKSKALAVHLEELASAEESLKGEKDLVTKVGKIAYQKKRLQDIRKELAKLNLQQIPMTEMGTKFIFAPEHFSISPYLLYEGNGFRYPLHQYEMLSALKLDVPFRIDFHFVSSVDVSKIKSKFICIHDSTTISPTITKLSEHQVQISFTPKSRGRHELHIQLSGNTFICGSPISAFVYMEPQLISALNKKPKALSAVRPSGIKCYGKTIYVNSIGTKVMIAESVKGNLTFIGSVPLRGISEMSVVDNVIFFSNTNKNTLVKSSMDGHILASIGGTGTKPGFFNVPGGVGISKRHEVYVCDTNNHRVQVFDKGLNLLRTFGEKGYGPGQFFKPFDLVFDEDENMYVVEKENRRVQVFTPQETHACFIGASSATHSLLHPVSAAIFNRNIYITDNGSRCILVFSLTGEFVTKIGQKDNLHPECIDIDQDGFIYISNNRSTVLRY